MRPVDHGLPDRIIDYFEQLLGELTSQFKYVEGDYFQGYTDAVADCIIIAEKVRRNAVHLRPNSRNSNCCMVSSTEKGTPHP
jgi:hypothetical protein